MRDAKLQSFIETTFDMLDEIEMPSEGRDLTHQIKIDLARAVDTSAAGGGEGHPVRDRWLERALEVSRGRSARVDAFQDAFLALEPGLAWRRRGSTRPDTDPAGHANAMIVGPGGLESRGDVWLGMTVMSPGARYPVHRHSPRELYFALTDGEWQRDEGAWFSPGMLGTVYNAPDALHSMRAGEAPFLALWLLVA